MDAEREELLKEVAWLKHMKRKLVDLENRLQTALAQKYRPPLPEPGTLVWWQDYEGLSDLAIGQFNDYGRIELLGTTQTIHPDDVRYWIADIVGPMQKIVDIPPVCDWPPNASQILAMYATVTSARVAPLAQIITREKWEDRDERE